jgi:hypothetical protein
VGFIYFDTQEIAGFYPALMGMRNPMNSWEKMDSWSGEPDLFSETFVIGENDRKLAKKLIAGGSEHRKFLRQIQVWADVNMPRYWWSEADTYKFGTKNSCSTMHKLHDKEFTVEDFYLGDFDNGVYKEMFKGTCEVLNKFRDLYNETKDYQYVIAMKRMLPESYIQMRTWNTNYEELMNMYHQRKHHRLKEEWGLFCDWCESLPYFKELCVDK